jgi:sulfhydrogenase subunit beta (sulfur reductase)
MEYILKKENLVEFIKLISENIALIAPKLFPYGDLVYSYIKNIDEITLTTDSTPILSAKEFFFQSREELFKFQWTKDKEIKFIPKNEPEERIFFGIRSCDLKGVKYLEQFYRRTFHDETVTRKVEKTTFISMSCNEPSENCFCVCCDGGPYLIEDTDIQLLDMNDTYMLQVFSNKGEELLKKAKKILTHATDKDKDKLKELIAAVDKKFARRSYMSRGVKDISLGKVPKEILDKFNIKCLSCGCCTFVCPTCSCFNVFDRKTDDGGVRIRTWDSCNYSGFTREVSGHNPRMTPTERLKRRFFHKISYQCSIGNGRIGCVGCGRCVAACPGGLDMSSFVTMLREINSGSADE